MFVPISGEVIKLKALLDEKSTTPQAIARAVVSLGDEGVPTLTRAAKGSKRREDARVRALFVIGDRNAHDAADEALRALFRGAPSEARDAAVQLAAFVPSRIRFATELRTIAGNAQDPSWDSAVHSLGALRDREAVPLLVVQARGIDTSFRILEALVGLRNAAARSTFEACARHPEPAMRTFALWGLAALGHETPRAKLVALLNDPDRATASTYEPGESIRAAQAICDVFGWPFEWSKSSVSPTRARCAEHFTTEHLVRCLRAFDQGRLDLESDVSPPA